MPGDGTVTADSVLTNPLVHEAKAKGIKVPNWLLEQGLDMMIVRKELGGKGPGYVLGNAAVEILVVRETNAEDALSNVRSTRLKTEALMK